MDATPLISLYYITNNNFVVSHIVKSEYLTTFVHTYNDILVKVVLNNIIKQRDHHHVFIISHFQIIFKEKDVPSIIFGSKIYIYLYFILKIKIYVLSIQEVMTI
jgi:hypothetical protein